MSAAAWASASEVAPGAVRAVGDGVVRMGNTVGGLEAGIPNKYRSAMSKSMAKGDGGGCPGNADDAARSASSGAGPVGGSVASVVGGPAAEDGLAGGSGKDELGEVVGELGLGGGEGWRVGSMVRAARGRRGLTLGELARAIGCARSYLSAIETGQRPAPREGLLSRLEAVLGVEAGLLVMAGRVERVPAEVRTELMARGAAAGGVGVDEVGGVVGVGRVMSLPLEVPVVGSVWAGSPRVVGEDEGVAVEVGGYVRTPDVDDADAFAARVRGDGMSPAYQGGDVVVFSPAREVSSGCDAWVELRGGRGVRGVGVGFARVYLSWEMGEGGGGVRGGRVRIQPLNPGHVGREVSRSAVVRMCRAVSVIRRI